MYQGTITDIHSMSSQNCKLRLYPEILSGKEIFSIHLNNKLPLRQIDSGAEYIEEHLFTQIPKIQNSLNTMGIRIKGLSIKNAFNQFNLTT